VITEPVGHVSRVTIAADVDYPEGAYILSSGGVVKVTTWGGEDIVLNFGAAAGTAGAVPVNVVYPVPIVRIWNTGSTLGTNTLNEFPCQIGGLR